MYYINATPTETGYYGNPQSEPAEGMLTLPEELLGDYIAAMGFVYLTVDGDTVTFVTINQAAYDAYQADHKETPPTADRDYEVGEYLTVGDTLYKVLLPIFARSQITPGTNVTETTIEAEMAIFNKEEN